MLKVAVINQIFLAQVARKEPLVLPVVMTSTTAMLSQYNVIFLSCQTVAQTLKATMTSHLTLSDMKFAKSCWQWEGIHHIIIACPKASQRGIQVYFILDFSVIKISHTIKVLQKLLKPIHILEEGCI